MRRATILLGTLFWVSVMIVGGYSFRQITYDDPFEALHHLSVGIFLFLASFLAIYLEVVKSSGEVTFREYFVQHQVAALAYLLTAGFIVDPFPATHEMPKHIRTLFYTASVLGCVNAVIKSALGCLKPRRHSIVSSDNDDRRTRTDSSPQRRSDDEAPPMFYNTNASTARLLRQSDNPNPFDAPGTNRTMAQGTSNYDFDQSYKVPSMNNAPSRQTSTGGNPFDAAAADTVPDRKPPPPARSDTNPFGATDDSPSPTREAKALRREETNPFDK